MKSGAQIVTNDLGAVYFGLNRLTQQRYMCRKQQSLINKVFHKQHRTSLMLELMAHNWETAVIGVWPMHARTHWLHI